MRAIRRTLKVSGVSGALFRRRKRLNLGEGEDGRYTRRYLPIGQTSMHVLSMIVLCPTLLSVSNPFWVNATV